MDLRGKKVAVVGLGSSGRAAALFCAARGAAVWGTDDQPAESLPAATTESLTRAGVQLHLGGQSAELLSQADLVVVSPGVPPSAALSQAEAQGRPVVAEVELASWYVEAPIIGITGTNGKSTVTGLIGEMMAGSGRPTFVGGNYGTPFIEAVGTEAAGPGGALVIELSSFQLERIQRLRPAVAVLLNLTEDHLDRYPSMAAYAAAKSRLFLAQEPEDAVVVNANDPLALSLARAGRGRIHLFGQPDGEIVETPTDLVDRGGPAGEVAYPWSLLRLPGAHNRLNAAAALLAARLAGATPDGIRHGLSAFRGLPHRMESAGVGRGVEFFNDSKATNVGATVAALAGAPGPAVLIAGGHDKGGDYGPLRDAVRTVRAGGGPDRRGRRLDRACLARNRASRSGWRHGRRGEPSGSPGPARGRRSSGPGLFQLRHVSQFPGAG